MHVVSVRRLREFWIQHPDAEAVLRPWYNIARKMRWGAIIDVRKTFAPADFVDPYTVFNIKGNAYRLFVKIEYATQMIFVHCVLTHAEYDKDAWK
jgi:mRNA interferase HigB